jgi:pyrroloquinoline quinone (PQQ) biosynthesis protein C
MTFFNQLQAETQNQRLELLSIPVLQDGLSGHISLETYTAFLIQAYHHVKHTVPLLMACGGKLPERLEWLRVAIGEYIEEEMGHQEWILNDLDACSADVEKIRKSTPDGATDIMVAVAFDSIQRLNPVGFFGMVLVLEGTSIALATQAASAIQEKLNLPDTAFSYLTSHGSLDISHMQTFESLMNQLEEPDDKQAVIHTAKLMYGLYGQIFKNLPHPN